MMFNVNDSVRVKLTDVGRQAHKKNHHKLYEFAKFESPKYLPPEEDANGWSTWQMWCLMQEFGPHIRVGCNAPFETMIEIIEPLPLATGKREGGA